MSESAAELVEAEVLAPVFPTLPRSRLFDEPFGCPVPIRNYFD